MFSKVALVACMLGLVQAGALWNPSVENSGYSNGGYGGYDNNALSYGAGYDGHSGYGNAHLGSAGAISHVSITKEITPSVAYTAGHGHGYGNSHGYAGSQGYSGGYGLGYNSHGFGTGLGHGGQYNHAISTVSQYNVHAAPSHQGSYAPLSHGSYGYPSASSSYGYGGKSW